MFFLLYLWDFGEGFYFILIYVVIVLCFSVLCGGFGLLFFLQFVPYRLFTGVCGWGCVCGGGGGARLG